MSQESKERLVADSSGAEINVYLGYMATYMGLLLGNVGLIAVHKKSITAH